MKITGVKDVCSPTEKGASVSVPEVCRVDKPLCQGMHSPTCYKLRVNIEDGMKQKIPLDRKVNNEMLETDLHLI